VLFVKVSTTWELWLSGRSHDTCIETCCPLSDEWSQWNNLTESGVQCLYLQGANCGFAGGSAWGCSAEPINVQGLLSVYYICSLILASGHNFASMCWFSV
jgi:hypothetical protein